MNRLINDELSSEDIRNAQPDNEVIAYMDNQNIEEDGKAIVRVDGEDELYFVQMPKEYIKIGDFIDNSDLDKIDILSEKEQEKIKELIKSL